MVALTDMDIATKEVLGWTGVHLFHFKSSSCSQKCRIFLRLKDIPCTLHHVDLIKGENRDDWYMGVNPRGLVPTLVHDGKVIIESNDILQYLEDKFPEPALIPSDASDDVDALLKHEDDLHLDIRRITMRYVVPTFLMQKKESELEQYQSAGSGLIQGEPDPHKEVELQFWRDMKEQKGISDDEIRSAIENISRAFDALCARLSDAPYLLGGSISVLDIAWYIYVKRMVAAGFPLKERHPALLQWFESLDEKSEFQEETATPNSVKMVTRTLHLVQAMKGTSLRSVAPA